MALHKYVIEIRGGNPDQEYVTDPETGNPAIFPNGPMARAHVQSYHNNAAGLAALGVDVGDTHLTAKPLPRDPDNVSFDLGA